jgi:glycosyltransferase involved in cell wall biosynthesis
VEISVIVTNHNYEKYLGRCIRSVLNQTLQKTQYEIILVDDASMDDSVEIAKGFGTSINLIELRENVGLASTSNVGLAHSSGRLIVRVDSDDFVHPSFLETFVLANNLLGLEFDAFSCDYFEIDSNEQNIRRVDSRVEPIACAVAFKQETLLALGAYRDGMRLWEDRELMRRFNLNKKRLHHVALPLYRYLKHDESLTAKVSE